MSPLHYSDPDREPRECPDCEGTGCAAVQGISWPKGAFQVGKCPDCDGSGRLGVEEAEADLKISAKVNLGSKGNTRWYWEVIRQRKVGNWYGGPHKSEALALSAARAALTETQD